ncbi:MAG: ABC transporter permease [Lachnospiraceae bacterium]|nr:ABC transporter permease [Lachnospiraceae bacterium]
MNRFFYGRLAFSNLKKNGSLYLPYVLAVIGTSAMYYILMAISRDEGIKEMPGSGDLAAILGLGCGVIGIFAVIFLFYTNSFLMKRRKKEFGLFNILGMEKRHIAKMMFWEIVMVAFVSILLGITAGVLLNKLVTMVLLHLVSFEVPFGFHISIEAIVSTVILFLCIFGVTLIYNLFQVQKAKPIELLQSASHGEKEPKTRWLLAVVGILALGGGYAIALFVENPVDVLILFFVAVILVILGTYCLFTAGSIAVLKLMRKNKNYYYKTRHFTSVSGMIYRMKQNAVGLSNICILSTMVLVMVSGTISLYMGVDSSVNNRYPKEINVTGYGLTENGRERIKGAVAQAAADMEIGIENISSYTNLSFTVSKDGENLNMPNGIKVPEGEMSIVEWVTLEDYQRMGGKKVELREDEVLVYTKIGDKEDQAYHFLDKTFQIKEHLTQLYLTDMQTDVIYDVYFVVVKDEKVLQEIYELEKSVYKERASQIVYVTALDVKGEEEQEIAFGKHVSELLAAGTAEGEIDVRVETRAEYRDSFMMFCGGFLFLGIFLGFVFLMATTLIIYYKQVSEGYEDKARFEIMQKVGMSKKEVRSSIRSQILKVFFLPLVMACIHLLAAFPMINRLIFLFGMADMPLFAICTVGTVGVFALIYAVVYGITARSYYKIVG